MQLDDLFRHSKFSPIHSNRVFLKILFNKFKFNSAYSLQRLQLPMSEAAFGSNFTNMTTKGILTFDQTYHYEE